MTSKEQYAKFILSKSIIKLMIEDVKWRVHLKECFKDNIFTNLDVKDLIVSVLSTIIYPFYILHEIGKTIAIPILILMLPLKIYIKFLRRKYESRKYLKKTNDKKT